MSGIIITMFEEYYNKFIILLRFYLLIGLDNILLCKIYAADYWKLLLGWLYPIDNKPNTNNVDILSAFIYNNERDDVIDTTESFKDKIANGTFEINWSDLLNKLAIHEYKPTDTCELVITYQIPNDSQQSKYKIAFVNSEHPVISFPQQLVKTIETESHKIFYAESSNSNSSVEITQIVREFSGPNQDFYIGNSHHVKPEWLRNEYGQRLFIDGDEILHIIDGEMKLLQFKKADIIKFLS